MTTETAEREAKEAAFARERDAVARTRKLLKRISWALAAGFILVMVSFGGTLWE